MTATDYPERVRRTFWSKVAVRSADECWPWRLSIGNHGYGQVGWGEPDGKHRMVLTHRLAYELTVGPIPGDLTIDHLCRNRRCCNPSHPRLLTNVENARLNGNAVKTHCKRGQEFTPENTRTNDRGHRWCKTCAKESKLAEAKS